MSNKNCYKGVAVSTEKLKWLTQEALMGISLYIKQGGWEYAVKKANKRKQNIFARLFLTTDPSFLYEHERSESLQAFFFDGRNEHLFNETRRLQAMTMYTSDDEICVSYKLLDFMETYRKVFQQLRSNWEHPDIDRN